MQTEIIKSVPKIEIPSNLHPVCEKCISRARKKYNGFTNDRGEYFEDGFAVSCPFIPPDETFIDPRIKNNLLPKDWEEINALKSPLLWAEKNIIDPESGVSWKAWPFQRGPLLCLSPRKCYRFGRRLGKTSILSIEILWFIYTSGGGRARDPNSGKIRRNLKVLVLAPLKTHIANIFDRIKAFINSSPNLKGSIGTNTKGSPQELGVVTENGTESLIRGFASGDKSGTNGLGARGQDADLVILDEGAFLLKETIKEVVAPILYTKTDPPTKFIMSSTPSGISGDYFESICTSRPDFVEFYSPATERPDWDKVAIQMEREFGSDQESYDKEVLAKFSPAGIGVYREDLVKLSQSDYEYGDRGKGNLIITFGIDWNKEHGSEIYILGTNRVSPHISFGLWSENIPKKEFTTPGGIERIVELNRAWNPSWIYVDAGGGDGGSLLRLYGRQNVGKNIIDARLKDIVIDYDFGSKIEVREPNGTFVKRPAKPLMVQYSVRKMELGEFKYPRSHVELTRQFYNYIVARRTISGDPIYASKLSNNKDHTLDALNLALVAIKLQFPSWDKEGISFYGNPFEATVNHEAISETNKPRVILPAAASKSTKKPGIAPGQPPRERGRQGRNISPYIKMHRVLGRNYRSRYGR